MSLQRKVSPERKDQEQTLVMGVTTSYFIKQTVFLSNVSYVKPLVAHSLTTQNRIVEAFVLQPQILLTNRS